jgi:signal transduction histidine kinase
MRHRPQWLDPRVVDAIVVAVVLLPGVAGLVVLVGTTGIPAGRGLVPSMLLMFAHAVALWWRRRQPLAVLAVVVVIVLVAQALGDRNVSSYLGPYAAAYALAVYGSRRDTLLGLAAIGAAALLEVVIVTLAPAAAGTSPLLLSSAGAMLAAAWGVGRYVRMRGDHIGTLEAYARQLEVERDEKARRAVLEERRRIARELHDQVAHHLGIAALQTGAARRWLDRDPQRAGSAMASAEDAVRVALTTMPVILEALRADDATVDLAPQPTLGDLDQLAARVAETGLPVELRVDGERRPLNPAVELTAYRVVQEALTNTMKHAGAARSAVHLRFTTDRLEIEVTDDGSGASTPNGDGTGLGLIGMRERVELLGGTLATGPRDGGGFAVRAVLPLAVTEGAA